MIYKRYTRISCEGCLSKVRVKSVTCGKTIEVLIKDPGNDVEAVVDIKAPKLEIDHSRIARPVSLPVPSAYSADCKRACRSLT